MYIQGDYPVLQTMYLQAHCDDCSCYELHLCYVLFFGSSRGTCENMGNHYLPPWVSTTSNYQFHSCKLSTISNVECNRANLIAFLLVFYFVWQHMSKVLNKCTVKTENENSFNEFIRGYRVKYFLFPFMLTYIYIHIHIIFIYEVF